METMQRRHAPTSAVPAGFLERHWPKANDPDVVGQQCLHVPRSRPEFEILHLSKLIQSLGAGLTGHAASKTVVKYDLSTDLPDILGDRAQICNLVTSLFFHACEAIGNAPGLIVLRTSAIHITRDFLANIAGNDLATEGGYAWLQVIDNACCMDDNPKGRPLTSNPSIDFVGRFLDRSACLDIVRNHRGAMWTASKLRGGTTMHVLLPCAQAV